jgi:hypothetical protein
VIEEALLPNRIATTLAHNRLAKLTLQTAGPPHQCAADLGEADEQVKVIGHQDISPNGDPMFGLATLAEAQECRVNCLIRKQRLPAVGDHRQEVKAANVRKKNHSGRPPGETRALAHDA